MFTLTAETDRVLCQLVMSLTVFFHWMCKMKYSCYQETSVIHDIHLLLNFWLRNAPLLKVGNPISDGIVFVFRLAGSVRELKSLKRFWHYLIAFRSCISNGKHKPIIVFAFFLISNFMKSNAVYEASLRTFVLRFETII